MKGKDAENVALRAQEKELKELRSKFLNAQQPGSPIVSERRSPNMNICPSLMQASQPDKDIVRYGLRRPSNTQSQSQEDKVDSGVLRRNNQVIGSVLNTETPSSSLQLCLDPEPIGVISSPPSSLHLGVTEESQESLESQESQES